MFIVFTESGSGSRSESKYFADTGSRLLLNLDPDPDQYFNENLTIYYCKKMFICLLKPLLRTFWLFKHKISSFFPFVGDDLASQKVEGATVHKAGSKIPV